MKKKRIFLTLAGLLFLLLVGTEVTINKKIENSIGQSLYVFSFESGEKSFSENQKEMLEDTEYDTCFLTEIEMTVKSFRSVDTMQIIGTNENFQYLSNKKIVSGAWFNALQVKRKNNVAVLGEAAALQYFGTTNIVSNKLEIGGSKYEVIGVIEEEDGANIYIPIDNIEAYHKPNVEYSQLWCNIPNEAELSLFLQKLGIKDNEIIIFRGGEYRRIVNLRIKIILGIIGLLLLIRILKTICKNMKEITVEVKAFLKTEYLEEWRKLLKQKRSMKNVIKIFFYGGGILYIWKIIRFDFILPNAESLIIKDEILTKINYVFKFYLSPHTGMKNFGYIDELNLISIIIFSLIALVGYLGVKILKFN